MKTIGIKLADGSFYPILEEGKAETKKLDLTTVQDNQTIIHVDVYRSESGTMEDAEYVDTLEIKNLKPHQNGEPSINLNIGLDENNELSAEISDPETGTTSETQVTLVSRTLSEANVPPVHFEKDPTISEASIVDADTEDSLPEDTMSDFSAENFSSSEPELADESSQNDFLISQDEIADIGLDSQNKEQGADEMLGASPNDEEFSFDSLMDETESKKENLDEAETDSEPQEEAFDETQIPSDDFDFTGADDTVNPDEISFDEEKSETALEESEPVFENTESTETDEPQTDSDEIGIPDGFIAAPVGIKASKGHKKTSEKKITTVDDVIAENSEEPEKFNEELNIDDIDLNEVDIQMPTSEEIAAEENNQLSENTEISDTDDFNLNPDSESSETSDVIITDDDLAAFGTDDITATEEAVADETLPDPFAADDPFSAETTASETPASEDEFALPDFDDEADGTAIVNEDSSDNFDLPDFTDSQTVDETSGITDTASSADENPFESSPFDSDFSSDSVNDEDDPFSTNGLTASDEDDPFSTNGLDSSDDTDTTISESAVGLGGVFDDDFGEPDLSSTDLSNDEFDMTDMNMDDEVPTTKDPTFQPNNNMFSDLYDKETLAGNSSSYDQEEEVKKKTKVPVIICIICAIICIIGAALVLFVIPSKINLVKKAKNQNPKEISKDISTDEEELPVVTEEEEPEVIIEITESAEEIVEDEPEAPAVEDEIVVATTPVVPEPPAPSAEKIEDIRYKIKWGDTLWDISNAYYKNPWRYKYLARYNGIKNPDHIVSGTWINIPAE